ncbi:hypothetical protein FC65_GL001520 [Ligilactobacillus acidipiscis DSM 15836]|uniref:HTH lysR-type domain-containing protein n=3 Tax=Ligilactobacillus acidipiscis TaxID=89059 RepID=A0ABR5PQH9_9LACO|nr:LysR family transcriptional regulator [Ligilactobacillus acidipiscis]KRM31815.1 hypothetical protein FC65_GL001520 [Ligilactobacillus acidipiscis DSM 15836]GAW64909.1 malolactic regulator [Ligilactobacillus acidipiscis]GEN20024.1 LysR family transcriptional regulator [Ligilactobacillus acidipiscis]
MNVKDLEYFVAVFDEKNFSKAAMEKNVSQPTITLAIKRLENEFGARLFIRDHSHQRLEPTRQGSQLLIHAQNMLTELGIAKKELAQMTSGKVRLGLPPIIGNYYFPKISPDLFRSKLINKIETVEAGSADLRLRLEKGDLDIALLSSLSPVIDDVLKVELFDESKFKIIVSKNNPLAQKDEINFSELKNENFIVLDKGFVHGKALKQVSHHAHYRPHIVYPTTDIHILKSLVAENVGIGFLTESAISKTDQVHSLTLLDDDQPTFYMSTAYRKNKILSDDEQSIVDLLQKELSRSS